MPAAKRLPGKLSLCYRRQVSREDGIIPTPWKVVVYGASVGLIGLAYDTVVSIVDNNASNYGGLSKSRGIYSSTGFMECRLCGHSSTRRLMAKPLTVASGLLSCETNIQWTVWHLVLPSMTQNRFGKCCRLIAEGSSLRGPAARRVGV